MDLFAIKRKPIITEYYELHRGFIEKGLLKRLYREVEPHLQIRSSRQSCVQTIHEGSHYAGLPNTPWTPIVTRIRDKVTEFVNGARGDINLALVHYYHDSKSVINWHSDREAIVSNIYSISIGDTRRFCLRQKNNGKVLTFDLHDGDMFIMKNGCQEHYEHCIKSIKEYNKPRINITYRDATYANY